MRFWSLIASLLISQVAAIAAPLPPKIRDFLQRKHRADLIERWAAVRVVSPARFAREMSATQNSFLAAGYFGITLRGGSSHLYKVSHAVFAAQGQIALNPARTNVPMGEAELAQRKNAWAPIMRDPTIQGLTIYQEYAGHLVGGASVLDELYGELIAAAQDSRRVPVLADFVSSDGLALRRPFIAGVPLNKILESERAGTELHRAYAMPEIWRQVARLQREAEALLFETGTTVDLLTPGNFLVQGQGPEAQVVHFDHGHVRPSPEVRELYLSWGVRLPPPLFAGVVEAATEWPLFPQHIVYSRVWGLTRAQALQYAHAISGAANSGAPDEGAALRLIAQTPVLPITMAPGLVDTAVIEECAAALKTQK